MVDAPDAGHVPVMARETVEMLAVEPGGRYIDCTLGGGGHALAIMEKASPGGQLLGLDADPEAIKTAARRLARYKGSIMLVNENFVKLEAVAYKYDFYPVHGILFDLGLSSLQLAGERGFSFQHEAPLDMRFSPAQKLTAAEIVNNYRESDLADIIWKYGEEAKSRQITRRIVQERPVRTTIQLAQIVEQAVGGRHGRIHPATRTFQALRIAVNSELDNLESALRQAIKLLGYRGRLVVISYHSLEDRIVKQFIQRASRDCICPPDVPVCTCGHRAELNLITRRVITPSEEEIRDNPRSRSARMRVAERLLNKNESEKVVKNLNFAGNGWSNIWRRPSMLRRLRQAFHPAELILS